MIVVHLILDNPPLLRVRGSYMMMIMKDRKEREKQKNGGEGERKGKDR